MSNTIKLKRGSGSDPGTSDLVVGEVAVRTDNGKYLPKKMTELQLKYLEAVEAVQMMETKEI